MPCILRLCAWLALVSLLAVGVHRWAPGGPGLPYGLGPSDLVLMSLVLAGAEHAARRPGPRWAFTIYGAIGGALFVPATLAGAESSFRAYIDRRAASITEYILLWVALVAGSAVLCRGLGYRSSRGRKSEPNQSADAT